MRLTNVIREIGNYYFIKKVIRKNKNTPEWIKNKLRDGYFGVIYTVINLPPEVFEGEEVYYQVYIIEHMKPINDYLSSINLAEVVMPQVINKVDREKGEFAFLIKYMPLFREFTLSWVLSQAGIVAVLVWLQLKWDVFVRLYDISAEAGKAIIKFLAI